ASSCNEQGDNLVDNIEKVYIAAAPAGNYKLKVSHKGTLKNGNQLYSLIMTGHGGPLSIEQQYLEELKIYPNPFIDYLIIDNNKGLLTDANINIYSASGKLILSEK